MLSVKERKTEGFYFIDGEFSFQYDIYLFSSEESRLFVCGLSAQAVVYLLSCQTVLHTTYIYNNWGHDQGLIEVSEVSAILAKCDSLQVD